MKKTVFDLNKPQDIDELNRLAFDDDLDESIIPNQDEDDLEESDDSETEDHLETRSIDSDTDHEIEPEDIEDVEMEDESDNIYYKSK